MNTALLLRRAACAIGIVAVSGAAIVACSQQEAEDALASGTSAASSAASAGASVGSSAASAASSAASSVVAGAPTSLEVPGVGPVTLDGPTAEAFDKAGGEAVLGLPAGQPEPVGDGTATAFAHGTIYSSPGAGAHLVQGEILNVYTAQGGPTGALGFPAADEAESAGGPDAPNGGWISEFQNGSISWLNQGDGTFKETITPK